MELHVEWGRSTALNDASSQNLIYGLDIDRLPERSGVYVFGRRYGNNFEALYVGKANHIRGRVKGQLNNLRLMQHVKNAKAGRRVLLAGEIITKPGQQKGKCLKLIERGLIRYFLSEGHDLVNKQGARIRRHEIVSSGSQPRSVMPRTMYVERGRGE
jgi:hypothetical protein